MTEGVVKFGQQYIETKDPYRDSKIEELIQGRSDLFDAGLIGQTDGIGYGNISVRSPNHLDGMPTFYITGTQTGDKDPLTEDDIVEVLRWDYGKNSIIAAGPKSVKGASSESMTHAVHYEIAIPHGIIYDPNQELQCVAHGHSPLIWKHHEQLQLPTTSELVEYGTPDMAYEVKRLLRESNAIEVGLVMLGHEDGVITTGKTVQEAVSKIISLEERAKNLK
jgi:L-ribulose-5-phosphate 4-epimerase